MSAHPSEEKMLRYMKERVWWRKMEADVAKFVKTCHMCQLYRMGSADKPKGPKGEDGNHRRKDCTKGGNRGKEGGTDKERRAEQKGGTRKEGREGPQLQPNPEDDTWNMPRQAPSTERSASDTGIDRQENHNDGSRPGSTPIRNGWSSTSSKTTRGNQTQAH
jgi:hypothetical protein